MWNLSSQSERATPLCGANKGPAGDAHTLFCLPPRRGWDLLLRFPMDAGPGHPEPRGPWARRPAHWPRPPHNSFRETGSEVAGKPSEGKGRTFSAQFAHLGGSRAHRPEPKTEKNCKDTGRRDGSSCRVPPESERRSDRKGPGTREVRSGGGPRGRTGAAPGGEGAAPAGTKKRKASDAGHRRESRGSPAARRRRWQRQCAGRGGPGAREDQPPPLRRCMVTTVRAMAEAVYRDVVLMQSQLARSPPDWEQLWRLAELRGRLCEVGQAFYTLASQAACSRPPESWLVPAPLPAGRGPVRGLPEQERRRADAIRPQPRGPDPRRHRAQLWK
ncbi:uncharacterized protein [Manis javanica]|uniref:uncharacterized protein n=1 Tax=Manis javanica TaxID=9974 RepID=UPI003C6CDDF3